MINIHTLQPVWLLANEVTRKVTEPSGLTISLARFGGCCVDICCPENTSAISSLAPRRRRNRMRRKDKNDRTRVLEVERAIGVEAPRRRVEGVRRDHRKGEKGKERESKADRR